MLDHGSNKLIAGIDSRLPSISLSSTFASCVKKTFAKRSLRRRYDNLCILSRKVDLGYALEFVFVLHIAHSPIVSAVFAAGMLGFCYEFSSR
jgi:hypothetical protein